MVNPDESFPKDRYEYARNGQASSKDFVIGDSFIIKTVKQIPKPICYTWYITL